MTKGFSSDNTSTITEPIIIKEIGPILGYIRLEPEGAFEETPCPFCGHIENLESSIVGLWQCEECDNEFWITPMRFYSGEPPKLILNKDGSPVGYQLPLSFLAIFPSDYKEGEHDNESNT